MIKQFKPFLVQNTLKNTLPVNSPGGAVHTLQKSGKHSCPLSSLFRAAAISSGRYGITSDIPTINRTSSLFPSSWYFLARKSFEINWLGRRFYESGEMADNKFMTDYAKMGTSQCKKCKQKLPKGSLRLAKLVSNPFSEEGGDMKQYHHPACLFETFLRARATTKIIEEPGDIQGFADLNDDDKAEIKRLIADTLAKKGSPKKKGKTQAKLPATVSPKKPATASTAVKAEPSPEKPSTSAGVENDTNGNADSDVASRDNSFRQFRRLCADIAEESSYTGKTKLVATYLERGNTGDGFKGDVYLLLKLLLPGFVKTVYNLHSKQLVKIFSQIFGTSLSAMVEDLEQGDAAETVKKFFEQSKVLEPSKKSTLTLQQVDGYLTELSQYTKEDDQQRVLTKISKRSTVNDLKMIVRLIKRDLRINAGAKHILEGLDPNAYPAFQASRDLKDVVDRVLANRKAAEDSGKPGMVKKLSVKASLLTPVLPMLAEACKSVEQAMKKCPNGMYAEIKYDGERVQVHKRGDHFEYYSRSLKPVLPHKVSHFKDYIPKAFPHGKDLILDSEVLLIDTNTGSPLPFGSLGIHKKQAFRDANVCLFIFDCLHYNGENLMDRPIKERRKILHENMTEIPNRILFSEMQHITKPSDLKSLMMKVFREGLEGLVLKDLNSVYSPGKRHWLKVKKDYLAEGAMADSADLVVLGAYFGTGNKGGIMSIFLMGVYDPDDGKWCTVTKCHSGFDDKTLEKLQRDLSMNKISKDATQVPSWLKISKALVPDFVVHDPKDSPVWEITGAEFSKSDSHTADGISIRFPRCTKMRDDKTWKEATDLPRLKALFKKSKEYSDIPDVIGAGSAASTSKMDVSDDSTPRSSTSSTPQKRKAEPSTPSPGPSPSKKAAKAQCKYGAACYQKSPGHREKYSHPQDSNGVQNGGSKTLPDIFQGLKFLLPESHPDKDLLKRYIIAYNGDVVEPYEESTATHIVVTDDEATKKDPSRMVTVDWLKKCLKKKQLLPYKANGVSS